MGAAIVNHKIQGQPCNPIREAKGLTLSIIAGLDNQPVLDLTTAGFVNTKEFLSSNTVRSLVSTSPAEGFDYSFEVTDGNDSLLFEFYADISKYREISDVETQVGLIKDKALESLIDFEGADVTMRLLEYKNVLNNQDYVTVPYIVKNRKSDLEKMQLVGQFFIILKTGIDEVFKIINIAADISTLGVIQAAINLTTTLFSLGILITELVKMIKQLRETFFPPILYHSAIKLKTWLTKAVNYLNYDVEFGTVWEELDGIVLLPSKDDEIGIEANLPYPLTSGILKPQDFGYNLADGFGLCRRLCNAQIGIIGNVVHIRPRKDPFWILNAGYVLPDALVEESPFTNNGTKRFNFEELFSSTTVSYQTDDSDYWTIQQLATGDANGDTISVNTVTPISVNNQRKVFLGGAKNIEIPYALCVRKDIVDDLLDFILPIGDEFDGIKDQISSDFDTVASLFTNTFPVLDSLSTYLFNRDGALKVENHFFSTPKLVYLGADGKIPSDFSDKIGAKAIYDKYFAYDSLVEGVRNPSQPGDTNAKKVFEGVKIPFYLKDAIQVLNNLYFSTTNNGVGRFLKLDWDFEKDEATVDYWVQDNWLKNVQENQI